jgi:rare lipoprotein A
VGIMRITFQTITPVVCLLLVFSFVGCAGGSKVSRSGKYEAVGVASWYGREYHGRRTASGEKFNMNALTAAHPYLPFGTRVQITNLDNGKRCVVKINDRFPAHKGRIIDVSRKTARKLGFEQQGLAHVKLEAKYPEHLLSSRQ